MRVIAMPAKDDMSSLLRVQWPAEMLRDEGADLVIADEPWLIKERDRVVLDVQAPECDVLVLCRPQHEHVAKSIPLLQKAGIVVVVDYDDDLTAVHHGNHAQKAFDPNFNPRSNWRWALEACRVADLVTVSTPALLDVYAKHGRGVVIPNRIPSWRVPVRPDPPVDGPVRLGWAGFIGTHPNDLPQLGGAVAIALAGTDEPFHVVGPDDPRLEKQIGWKVKATGLIDKDRWPQTLAALLDVGVSPAEDSRFNQGKSCLRVLEGAAAGIAMIASPIPDNQRAAADGLCLLASSRRQWASQLKRLVLDGSFREDQAARGQEAVKMHLMERNIGAWWDAWELAFSRSKVLV